MLYHRLLARCRRLRSEGSDSVGVAGVDHLRLATDGGQPNGDGRDGDDDGDGIDEAAADPDETGIDSGEPEDATGSTTGSPAETGDLEAADDDAVGTDGETGADDTIEDTGGADRSNVEITDAGEAEPADPKWERPDLDDIPEFEVRADEPVVSGGTGIGDRSADPGAAEANRSGDVDDPTAGMPNTARAPGATRISAESTDAYIVAMELCARLPDDVRLPEEAAELVPTAVEAELEQDIQQFAASEFGTQTPHVDTLAFEDVDGEIWLRLRIGLPTEGFADIDPEEIRSFALEQLEGVL